MSLHYSFLSFKMTSIFAKFFFYLLFEIQFVGMKMLMVFPYNAFNFYWDGCDVPLLFMILVVCILSVFFLGQYI